jgi:predicted Zn finger-like uncharacterized protein
MIVTCPECGTRYMIDPRALGVTGRSVRCTSCAHVWMQLPPEDAPHRVDLPPPGATRPQPARIPAPPRSLPLPPPAAAAVATMPEEIPRYPSERADEDVVRGGNRPLLVATILVLVLAMLWFGRDTIVDRVPSLDAAYAALGIAAGDLSNDLEFRAITSNRRQENGRATLVIEGEVANVSAGARHVPPLRITLEDSGKHPIKSWTVMATRDRLMPGESVAFRSSIADPGAGTVGASVTFDDAN